MKRCPECRRDYYDDTLLYCLDDGNALLEGPRNADTPVRPLPDEPATAILSEPGAVATGFSAGESPTRAQINTTDQTATFPRVAEAEPQSHLSELSERQSLSAHRAAKPHEKFDGRNRLFLLSGIAVLVLVAGFFGYRYFAPTSSKQIESIAVMPFQNVGGSTDTEYLSDGISEALINSLTELQQLKVIARSTAFRYKGKDVDPQAVGRELNVGAVLMGRVRQVGESLNVQVDLVDASTGAQLWGKEYERKASDVLSIKQAITREVTENLKLRLSGQQQQQLTKSDTTNAEAYQFYLRGRYFWNKRTAEDIRKAIEQFQQAIDRDPNYALGYVGLTDSYLLLDDYTGVPTNESLPKAKAAVEKALQIDDSLAEAHTSLAKVYTDQWLWAEAEQEFRRAIALNPNYPTAHHWFSSAYLRPKGQLDDALREAQRALELDPLSPVIGIHAASIYLQKNDINSAIEQSQRIIDLDPRFASAHRELGWAFFKLRRYDEAISEFQKAVELSGRQSHNLCGLGFIYAVSGKSSEATQILRELEDRYKKREAIGMNVAAVLVGLGQKDQAFAWLEKDFEQRSGLLPDVAVWPNFDDLRSDPHYADLLRRMRLEP